MKMRLVFVAEAKIFQFSHQLKISQAKICVNLAHELLNKQQVNTKVSKFLYSVYDLY